MAGLMDDEPTGRIDGIDADQLLQDVESGGARGIPMHADAPTADHNPTSANPSPAAPTQQTLAEYEFEHGGKAIKVPFTDPRAKTWIQQGYDYSQKMAAFNQQKADLEGSYSPYKMIDEYAKQNPDWWKHVESAYQSKDAKPGQAHGGASPIELPSEVKQKLQELDEIKPFISELKSEREQTRIKQEDDELAGQMKSIREKYADLDWKSVDEAGQSIEKRVLKHAVDNDIKNYKTAFNDYYQEHLVKLQVDRAKENATKELQKRTKLGIIGESPTPRKGPQSTEGVRNKSYENLLNEAKEELGIA